MVVFSETGCGATEFPFDWGVKPFTADDALVSHRVTLQSKPPVEPAGMITDSSQQIATMIHQRM